MNFFLRRALAFALFFGLLSPAWDILEAQTLRVPYVSLSPTAGPLWIAYEAGFFKRNNVSTELLYIPGGSTIIQAIISGDVKVANMAPPSPIGAWAKGFDLVLIASGVDQLLETVVTGPAIRSPADLRNKKIGVSRYGSLTDIALREALRHYNLNPDKDVTILQTGGEATRFAALTTGAIDGAMLSGDKLPTWEALQAHGRVRRPIGFPVASGLRTGLGAATFNPTGHSYYHWLADGFPSVSPAEAIAGILLLIGWIFFVRTTLSAIGTLGIVLMAALFSSIVWWIVSKGWHDVGNRSTMAWIVLLILGLMLGIGVVVAHPPAPLGPGGGGPRRPVKSAEEGAHSSSAVSAATAPA